MGNNTAVIIVVAVVVVLAVILGRVHGAQCAGQEAPRRGGPHP